MTDNTHSESKIYMALELSNQEWKLAFGDGRQTRQVNISAGDQARLKWAVAKAKEKFKLPEEAKVYSCYEAGRDGFWIHRLLTQIGVTNLVVDPASIEVNRRARRIKTDRLDAAKLLTMLLRYWMYGEKTLWSVLHVPSVEEEASRRLHRNAERLKKEKRAHQSRLRSLLALHGLKPCKIPENTWVELKDWKGDPLPAAYVAELQQEQERLDLVKKQLVELATIRKRRCKVVVEPAAQSTSPVPAAERWSVKLAQLRGVGAETAWNLGHEFFGWRKFRNRREVGAAAGLTGSPYNSGDSAHEQGISKAGNARVRHWMTELAWRWLLFQPRSALAQWYEKRFGGGTGRMRRVGIVALARKLLVALWRYGAQDQMPEGVCLLKM